MRGWLSWLGGALLVASALVGCSDGYSDSSRAVYESIEVVKTSVVTEEVEVEIQGGGLRVDFPVPEAPEAKSAVVEGLSFDFADGDVFADSLAGQAVTLSFGDFTGTTGTFELLDATGGVLASGGAVLGGETIDARLILTAVNAPLNTDPSVGSFIDLETFAPQVEASVSTDAGVTAAGAALDASRLQAAAASIAEAGPVVYKAANSVNNLYELANDPALATVLKDSMPRPVLDAVNTVVTANRVGKALQSSAPLAVDPEVMEKRGVAVAVNADPATGELKVNVAVGGTTVDLSSITLDLDETKVTKTVVTTVSEVETRTNRDTGLVEQVQTIRVTDEGGNELATLDVTTRTVQTTDITGKPVTRTTADLTATTRSGTQVKADAEVTTAVTRNADGTETADVVVIQSEEQAKAGGETVVVSSTETKATTTNAATGSVIETTTVEETVANYADVGKTTVVNVVEKTVSEGKTVTVDATSGDTTEIKTVNETATTYADADKTTVTEVVEKIVTEDKTVAVDETTGTTTESVTVDEEAVIYADANKTVVTEVVVKEVAETKTIVVDGTTGTTTESTAATETETTYADTSKTTVVETKEVAVEETVETTESADGIVSKNETATTTETVKDGTGAVIEESVTTDVTVEESTENTTTTTTTETKEVTGSTGGSGGA